MRTVWKYIVQRDCEVQHLQLPGYPIPVAIRDTNGEIEIWVELDPDGPPVSMPFLVVGTGDEIPTGFKHVDTCSSIGGRWVWHLYRCIPE